MPSSTRRHGLDVLVLGLSTTAWRLVGGSLDLDLDLDAVRAARAAVLTDPAGPVVPGAPHRPAIWSDWNMTISGEYAPSPTKWVRDQVQTILDAGTTASVEIQGRPVILMTMVGATSGKVRRVPVMRVEHDGLHAAVASKGGAPDHPAWYANLTENPVIEVQDGTRTWTARAREIAGEERAEWWTRCVAAFPPYATYAEKTDRTIPVLLLEPVS